jgi:Tfp pilus assembly protein PilX
MFIRLRDDERGLAMVIALLVSFVLLTLATVVVAQSIHDSQSSGLDRRRLESINAAEAGDNYYYAYLQSTTVTTLNCQPVTQTIASAPATASFTATPTFYDATGTVMPCSSPTPFTSTYYPASVAISTTGTVTSQTPRTMQTYIRLTPVYGGFGQAILSQSGATFPNNFDIYGNNGNDGDIYILTGNLAISNTPHVRGNVYVPAGSANISGNSNITGTLWANGSIVLSNPAIISTNVITSTGTISGSGSIGGNATAASTITGVTVAGTRYANTVSPTPPTQTFPKITYGGVDKTGYTIHTFSGAGACTLAQTFVESTFGGSPGLTGNHIVYITGATPCTYSNSNNSTVNMKGNLMIISDWGINISQKSTWAATTANTSAYFISTWRADGNTTLAHDACGTVPTPWTSSTKSIATGNNTDFNTNAQAFFYSPCTVTMANQSNFYGQVMGDPVSISNQFTMTYRPVLVPGYGTVTSFKEDIAYVREVANP